MNLGHQYYHRFRPLPRQDGQTDNLDAESDCLGCGETLLLTTGDDVWVHVNDTGEVDGVYCTQCVKEMGGQS